MLASAILITKNQKEYLRKTISTLLTQTLKEDLEIIVVDSGSTDGAREYLKREKITLLEIQPKYFNYANAFNVGASQAKGAYLIRLSGDALPQGTNFVAELIKPYTNPKVGGTYGKYVISHREGYYYPNYWPAKRFPENTTTISLKKVGPFSGINKKNRLTDFARACCSIRKAIWDKRPFNEKLRVGEDAEYAWFLHVCGWDITYTPHALCLHEHEVEPHLFPNLNTLLIERNYQLCALQTQYWLKRLLLGIDDFKDFRCPVAQAYH